MNVNEILLILAGLLGAGFLYQTNKRKSAEALNDNIETKEKLLEIDKEKAKNDAKIEVEDQKQEDLKQDIKEIDGKKLSLDDIVNIFRKP